MAVRPIDAGVLQDNLTDIYGDCNRLVYLKDVLDLIDDMPTLTPPNEPRMINADKLAKRIAGHSNYHGDSILAAIYCAAEGKENDAPIRSIETPPNEQVSQARELDDLYTKLQAVTGFTVEQLLEMFLAGYTLEKPDYSNHFVEMESLAETAPPAGAVRTAKLGCKRIWVDENNNFVAEAK